MVKQTRNYSKTRGLLCNCGWTACQAKMKVLGVFYGKKRTLSLNTTYLAILWESLAVWSQIFPIKNIACALSRCVFLLTLTRLMWTLSTAFWRCNNHHVFYWKGAAMQRQSEKRGGFFGKGRKLVCVCVLKYACLFLFFFCFFLVHELLFVPSAILAPV